MILTITLNPSIDISYPLSGPFVLDGVNRVEAVEKTAGGKGLNVTRVLQEAKQDVLATGFIGENLGQSIKAQLDQAKIKHHFFPIKGETRNCIAILHEGCQTEILESGPTISQEEASGFLDHLDSLCKDYDIITISGSLPKGLASDYYEKVISLLNSHHKKIILDCSGSPLQSVLLGKSKPTLIKPNLEELQELLSHEIDPSADSLKDALSQSLFDDIPWIVVSLGSKGAFAKHGNHFYRVHIPKIQVQNPVGSGDATVAGIAWALSQEDDDHMLLKKANALGMLNAQEKLTGHVNMEKYQELIQHIKIEEV
ncbi:tagatose-6-phosphate kinase [Streptococcus didelphis]|uniref:tagatose-6-phosphate kinase n=1 Tax=Streptococcus didelphis TaxID=102886 RepID=UPI00036C43D6|nr:tagatose-6-phosphate kinase [Streptococcus didelphis]